MSTVSYPETLQAGRSTAALWVLAVGKRPGRMSALGRFLPVAILSPELPLLGESRHSSKEFICSVRPSLNDRFRLGAAGQIMKLRPAENDPEQTLGVVN